MDSAAPQSPARHGSLLPAILVGGLAAGVGDFAFALWHYEPATAARIARSVAAGLLGREAAAAGGGGIVALGLCLHFAIATGAAATFNLAARRWPMLGRHPGPTGLAYGAIVYFVMNSIVVPWSAVGRPDYPPPIDWVAVVAHMVLVGLPITLAHRWLGSRLGSSERS